MTGRCWRLPPEQVWARAQEGYPAAVPFKVEHFDMAWDYSGPVWDGTARQKAGGVWACFRPDGEQSYDGSGFPAYRLDEVTP